MSTLLDSRQALAGKSWGDSASWPSRGQTLDPTIRTVPVFALGLNHTTAPLDLRGRFAFAPESLTPALRALQDRLQRATPEAALVSTCNRTELYVAADKAPPADLVAPTLSWLAAEGGVSADHLKGHTYVLEDRDAARHAFRVASGLDSMVLGEPQILGQM